MPRRYRYPRRAISVFSMKLKLLSHEAALVECGEMLDITHPRSSSLWLRAESTTSLPQNMVNVYRPMADEECLHLIKCNSLPNTQPYQVGHCRHPPYRASSGRCCDERTTVLVASVLKHRLPPLLKTDTRCIHQAIIEDENGRVYAEKYLRGQWQFRLHIPPLPG